MKLSAMTKKKQKHITREQMLSSRPAKNELVKWQKDENGEVTISIPRKKGWLIDMVAKFSRIPDQKRIALDEIGSEVWYMCDGKTTVENMIAQLSRKYKLNRKEAEISLTTYLKQLGKKRLVGFLVPKKIERKR